MVDPNDGAPPESRPPQVADLVNRAEAAGIVRGMWHGDIGSESFAAGERLTQADITTGVMVDMYRNMRPHLLPPDAYSRLDAPAERCHATREFRRTALEDVAAAPSKAEPHLATREAAT